MKHEHIGTKKWLHSKGEPRFWAVHRSGHFQHHSPDRREQNTPRHGSLPWRFGSRICRNMHLWNPSSAQQNWRANHICRVRRKFWCREISHWADETVAYQRRWYRYVCHCRCKAFGGTASKWEPSIHWQHVWSCCQCSPASSVGFATLYSTHQNPHKRILRENICWHQIWQTIQCFKGGCIGITYKTDIYKR